MSGQFFTNKGEDKMWKKIVLVLVMLSFMVGTAFAGIKEMQEAYWNKDYTTAISEADKVIADTNASVADKATAQYYIGHCYFSQKQYEKAIPEFQKVISNYSEEKYQCASAQRYIGYCYYNLKQYDKAISEYQKVIDSCPGEKGNCADAQRYIGYCYKNLGDSVKSQEAHLKILTDYPEITSQVKTAMGYVNFASMTDEEVLTILKRIRRATSVPDTEIITEKNPDGTPTARAKQAEAILNFLSKIGGDIAKLEGGK